MCLSTIAFIFSFSNVTRMKDGGPFLDGGVDIVNVDGALSSSPVFAVVLLPLLVSLLV